MAEPLTQIPGREIRRIQWWALCVGLIAMLVCIAGAFVNRTQFFHSYLFAFMFWVGIGLGAMAIMMVHHLTSGSWGIVIRRLLESASKTMPLMAVLFLPVAFGLPWIYGWVHPVKLPRSQMQYLTVPFFLWRAVVYFVLWIVMAYLLTKWSRTQDEGNGVKLLHKMRVLSGPGLVIYGITVSFASIDWLLSLEPRWYSTIYGLMIIAGQLLSAMAFVIVVLALLSRLQPYSELLQPDHLHSLGKLLLAFVILWAYMAFSQLLVVWEGNLSEEIPWYLRRWSGGWVWVGLVLIVFHFFLPFFLLLSQDLKRHAKSLGMLAGFILIVRGVDLFWLTAPEFSSPGVFHIHWMDILLPIGMGGLWCAFFAWQLRSKPLVPVGDPQLEMALKHE